MTPKEVKQLVTMSQMANQLVELAKANPDLTIEDISIFIKNIAKRRLNEKK